MYSGHDVSRLHPILHAMLSVKPEERPTAATIAAECFKQYAEFEVRGTTKSASLPGSRRQLFLKKRLSDSDIRRREHRNILPCGSLPASLFPHCSTASSSANNTAPASPRSTSSQNAPHSVLMDNDRRVPLFPHLPHGTTTSQDDIVETELELLEDVVPASYISTVSAMYLFLYSR